MSENILNSVKKLKLASFYDKWIKSNHIVGATIEVTADCNFDCIHCYMCDLKHGKKQLSFEQIIKIIDILYDAGVIFLTFSGGDPFMRKDFKDIYIYAKKKGFFVDIFSNGTLIDEEWINTFIEYPPLLIDLSIYGASNETYELITGRKGAFDRFLHTLKILQTAEIRFAIKAPLLSVNCNELKKMREISERFSKESFRFSYEIVPDRNNNLAPLKYELDPLDAVLLEIEDGYNLNALRETGQEPVDRHKLIDKSGFAPVYFCSIGNLSVHIDFLGNVAPCIECAEKLNIFDYDFKYIIAEFQKYKKVKAKPEYKCIGCKAAMFCSSCPQVRKRIYGDEQTTYDRDCIVAKLKYKFYADNFSINDLKKYYLNLKKGGC